MIPISPKFPDRLVTSPIWGRDDYVRIEQKFTFMSDVVGPVTAEAGFDCDGASIPGIVRPLINPHGKLRWCAVPHDVTYWYRAVSCEPDARKLNREEADEVILEAMLACGCSWVLSRTVHSQLRLWGGAAWDNNLKKRELYEQTGIYSPPRRSIIRRRK